MTENPLNSNNIRINPGTLFIPLGNMDTAENTTENSNSAPGISPDRIDLLLRATGHRGLEGFDEALESSDAPALLVNHLATHVRYHVTVGHVTHPTHGAGLVLLDAHSVIGVSNFITDLLRTASAASDYTPVIGVHSHSVTQQSADATESSELPSHQDLIPWCELIDVHNDMASSTTCVVNLAAPNHWDRVMLINTDRFINNILHNVEINNVQDTATATVSEEDTLITPEAITTAPETTTPETAAPDTAQSNSATSDNTESMAGYDELLSVVLRGVAAQIEGTDIESTGLEGTGIGEETLSNDVETVKADRDAMVATLVNAATMLEAQAQHENEQINHLVLSNLDNITHRMEAADPVNTDLAGAESTGLNAAQLSLAQAAQLASARISQFTARKKLLR